MDKLIVATAQFEYRSREKTYNLSMTTKQAKDASDSGVQLIAFHECSITGYTFARKLSKAEMLDVTEPIPSGESIKKYNRNCCKVWYPGLRWLFEKDEGEYLYKAYVCVNKSGLLAKYRKLHPFINPHLTPGDHYCVFEYQGWKFGMLICYDNNIIENVRATKLLGAGVILMLHVTMCTPSIRPGAGFVDPRLREKMTRFP